MNPYLLYLLCKNAEIDTFDYEIPLVFKILFVLLSLAITALFTLFIIGFIRFVIIN